MLNCEPLQDIVLRQNFAHYCQNKQQENDYIVDDQLEMENEYGEQI